VGPRLGNEDRPTQSDDEIRPPEGTVFDQTLIEPRMPSAQSSETPPLDVALNDRSGIHGFFWRFLAHIRDPRVQNAISRVQMPFSW